MTNAALRYRIRLVSGLLFIMSAGLSFQYEFAEITESVDSLPMYLMVFGILMLLLDAVMSLKKGS